MCVQFNKDWLPYVLGGLFQLVNPSSWEVTTPDDLELVLSRATSLLDLFGQAPSCMNTYVGNCLTANHSLPNGVLTTVLSLTVEPGEYELAVQAVLSCPGAALHFTYSIWDGASKLSEGEATTSNGGWFVDIGLTAHIAPTVTTTYYFKAIPFGADSFAYADPPQNGTGAHVTTCLRAYPLGLRGPAGPPGSPAVCTALRFSAGCVLQSSCDGGETWVDVPGWADNFKACVISNAPITGLPPNPGGETHDQLACSIADYLASTIILEAMTKAVNAIQDDLTMLTFGASVLTLIPEFVLVAAAYDAFASIYGIISEGTLTDYQDALTNASLWDDVRCCIYGAIVADGYVTPGNFAAILTCVNGITSAPSDVVGTIHSFLEALGATGTAQLSQIAGLNTGATCDCGSGAWCTWWQTGAGLDMCNGNSTSVDPGTGGGPATCSGGVWVATESSGHDNYYTIIDFVLPFARTIRNARVDYTAFGHDDDLRTIMYDASGATLFTANVRNWAAGGGPGIAGVKKIRFICGMGGPTFFTLSSVRIGGPAQGSPWGVSNGVCG